MSEDLKPTETLLLLDLLSKGGAAFLKDLGTWLYNPKVRVPMKERELIAEENRKLQPSGNPKAVARGIPHISLTEKGRTLIEGLLRTGLPPMPERSSRTSIVMANILKATGTYFLKKNIPLTEVFAVSAEDKPAHEQAPAAD
ncbi:MAG: hypothetical protein LBQ79_12555 [Deltaproteobacteria bacterium]|jgi:hypothetical protein|nr:hypothetical protein [Deltaproteobacteria bacterium]